MPMFVSNMPCNPYINDTHEMLQNRTALFKNLIGHIIRGYNI